jgi:heme/copper-type cytochrome/quinol oxidase subunit 1
VPSNKRLILAHFWLAFAGFGCALPLGEWQMFMRSPLAGWISNPEWYYRSVTAHGTTMAYVLPTLVAMGFGYFVTETALKRPMIGAHWAWLGLALVALGTVMAIVPVATGSASVLYTFYPPLIGNPFYYLGVVLVVVGSWIWVALMSANLYHWTIPVRRCRCRCSRRSPAPISGAGRRSAPLWSCCSRSCRWRSDFARQSMPGWRASSSPGRCTRSSISG